MSLVIQLLLLTSVRSLSKMPWAGLCLWETQPLTIMVNGFEVTVGILLPCPSPPPRVPFWKVDDGTLARNMIQNLANV